MTPSPRDEARAVALLGDLRRLRIEVDVRDGVLRAVREISSVPAIPLAGARPTGRELLAGALLAASAVAAALLAAASLPVPVGPHYGEWALTLLAAARHVGSALASIAVSIGAGAGRAVMALIEMCAGPRSGQAAFSAITTLSIFCLAAAAAGASALFWREWRAAHILRRLS